MTRQERAKLFMPFDAMKGLQEELRKREEKHTRVAKRDLSEESQQELSERLAALSDGIEVSIEHYRNYHYVVSTGKVTKIDFIYKYLVLNCDKIKFSDIYKIENII